MSQTRTRIAAVAVALALAATRSDAGEPETLNSLVTSYLESRGTKPMIAHDEELARRYSIDLTGVVPFAADYSATKGMSPAEMFDYFRNKGPMAHTGTMSPYLWTQLLRDSDWFLFSNSVQFSQVEHIQDLVVQLTDVYEDGADYRNFTRWFLTSQVFLNRFPSGADRANASFFLLLGRDSLPSEVPSGDVWNGYTLVPTGNTLNLNNNPLTPNPDYHEYQDARATRCAQVGCETTLWGKTVSTPEEVIEMMVGSTLFAEALVNRYWAQAMGSPCPSVEFPELQRVLVKGLIENSFNINWLIRELMTSAPYVQEMMFR